MNDPDEFIRVECESCGKRLKVPQRMRGRTVACPRCRSLVSIPAADGSKPNELQIVEELPSGEQARAASSGREASVAKAADRHRTQAANDDSGDDDEYRLADDSPRQPKTSAITPDLFDELLADTPPQPSLQEDTDSLTDPLDDGLAELGSVGSEVSKVFGEVNQPRREFRFACKVCGTALFATEDQIGHMTRCPDCYSEFSVPRPTVKPKTPGPTQKARLSSEELALQEAGGFEATSSTPNKNAEDYLRRAQAELDEEKSKNLYETYDFDAQTFMVRTFGFLRDPGVYPVTLGPGFLLGLVLVGADYVWSLGGETDSPLYFVATLLILGCLGGPILLGCLLNGLAVLQAAANNERTVSDWPAFNIGESIGELFMLAVAFALSALPGGLLGWVAVASGMDEELAIALTLLSAWLLFPIVLLSMMDHQSVTALVSAEVIGSLRTRPNAWASMYLLTALAGFLIFATMAVLLRTGDVMKVVCAMALPLVIFFIFHQIGNLASQIAAVTNLSFDEEDELDDAEESND